MLFICQFLFMVLVKFKNFLVGLVSLLIVMIKMGIL